MHRTPLGHCAERVGRRRERGTGLELLEPQSATGANAAGYPVLLHWLDVPVDAVVQRARTRGPHTVGAVASGDRKSTRLNSVPNAHLVCRLLLEKKIHTE